MRTTDTNIQKESTLIQRFLARLTDPSPARYSAAINLRTFGRVTLDTTAPPESARVTHINSQKNTSDRMPRSAAPRTAA